MLGFADPLVAAVYLLMMGSALLCVIYGAINWNKEGEISQAEAAEERAWTSEELAIEKKISGEDEP